VCAFFCRKFASLRQKKNGNEDPKAKISEKSKKFASFRGIFFWDSPVLDNQSYLVANM
jgi:hypothetical protein